MKGRSKLGSKIAMALTSMVVALGVAESLTAAARSYAFPYLNIFVRSARFGVVLLPSSATRVRSRTGRITDVRTNALGFRGPEWQAAPNARPIEHRIILLGDSQVLGYGVDEADAPASALMQTLGADWEVLPIATPSWGPIEYVRALEDHGPRFRSSWVVVFANLASDWGEAFVPNTARSDAADGWLTRRRRDAPAALALPGRGWLFGRSHIVFLARELWALRGTSRDALVPPATVAERLLSKLGEYRLGQGIDRSPLGPHLDSLKAQCDTLGCRLLVVALPIDLQVDPREWRKYRATRLDLVPTEGMLDDLVVDAERREIPALNALPVLRAASPGAFLPDDDHLSPEGLRVLSGAIGELIGRGKALATEGKVQMRSARAAGEAYQVKDRRFP